MSMGKRHSSSNGAQHGYTLLELLFAVAIVAVLALAATSAYTKVMDRAKNRAAIGDIAELEVAIERYRSTHFSLPDTLPAPGLDPWGIPYIYTKLEGVNGKGSARKDHKLNPLNSDFDLFSAGKNGTYKSQISNKDSLDDIIRARNGAYIGLAADY